MTLSAVGTRYAHALADVVTTPGAATRADAAVAELKTFEATLASSTELRNALTSPAVPPGRKRAVVGRLAESLKLSRVVRNFLYVLIDHGRIAILPDIVAGFERVVDERLGFAQADISSAAPLTDAQRVSLTAELEKRTGSKIRMRFSIDPTLIGGVVARIGSTVFDGSVRGQLASLGRRLGTEA